MAQETLMVDANEDLDAIIGRLRQVRSKDVLVVLPNKTRALETLDQFNALRRTVREESINLTFAGGNKTVQGLAKLLGFQIDKGDGAVAAPPAADSDNDNLPSGFANFGETPSQQATRPFGGPPGGFVVNGNTSMLGQPTIPTGIPQMDEPPASPRGRNAQDIFSGLANMQPPEMPNRSTPPPPANFGLSGDTPLTRENAPNFFGGGPAIPNPPPPPAFDMSGGSHTMSYEEAIGSGLLGDESPTRSNSSNLPFDLADDRDEDVPSILDNEPDTAAAEIRQRSGVRRGDREAAEPRVRSRGNRRDRGAITDPDLVVSKRRGPALGAGLTAALAGVGGSFGRVVNAGRRPTQVAAEGIRLDRPKLAPEVQRERKKQSSLYSLFAYLAIAGIFLIVVGALWMLLTGGSNPTGNPQAGVNQQRVNLVLSTGQVTNTVSILLDTKAGASSTAAPQGSPVSGSASTSNPTDQQTGIAPRLGVTEINTGSITKEGEWPAFGSTKKVEGFAQGQVTIFNAGVSAKSYPAGQVIYKNPKTGVEYKLVNSLSVGAGDPVSGGRGQANGVVQAGVPGPVGNFEGAGRIVISDSVIANIGALNGGTERTVKVVSKEDMAALQKKLMDEAQTDAKKQVDGKFNAETQGIQFLKTADPKCSFSKNVGEESDKLTGNCAVSLRAIVYNKAALSDAVKGALIKNPKQSIEPSSLKFNDDGQVKEENGRLIYTVGVTARIFQPLTEDDKKGISNLVLGKSAEDAKAAVLSAYPQLLDVNFSDFKGTLPTDPTKLDLKTMYDYENDTSAKPTSAVTTVGTVVGTVPVATPSPSAKS